MQEKSGRRRVFGVWEPLLGFPTSQDGTDRETPTQIFRWHVVLDSDPNGSFAVFRWQRLGARGFAYLTDIYDTPRAMPEDRTRLFLATPSTPEDYAHQTQLSWEPREPVKRALAISCFQSFPSDASHMIRHWSFCREPSCRCCRNTRTRQYQSSDSQPLCWPIRANANFPL